MLNKKRFYIVVTALCCIVSLQAFWIAYLYTNPKIETIIETQIKEVEVEKEVIVEVPVEVEKEVIIEIEKEVIVEVEKEPVYVYNVTSAEREMLARLVYLEANTESADCQRAVISVVINRWQSGAWGTTLKGVIYAKNQFSPADLIYKTTPNQKNYDAVDYVLKNGCTLPSYIYYFRAKRHFDWDGYVPYAKIDRTYFGYLEKYKTN